MKEGSMADLVRIGDLLPTVVQGVGYRLGMLMLLWRRWDSLVGAPVCHHAWPSRFVSRERLVVVVSDSVWMQQLSLNRIHLEKPVGEALGLGAGGVRIRFEVGDVARLRGGKVERRAGNPIRPLPPPEVKQEVELVVRGEGELQEALRSLFVRSATARG